MRSLTIPLALTLATLAALSISGCAADASPEEGSTSDAVKKEDPLSKQAWISTRAEGASKWTSENPEKVAKAVEKLKAIAKPVGLVCLHQPGLLTTGTIERKDSSLSFTVTIRERKLDLEKEEFVESPRDATVETSSTLAREDKESAVYGKSTGFVANGEGTDRVTVVGKPVQGKAAGAALDLDDLLYFVETGDVAVTCVTEASTTRKGSGYPK